jgi:hypothetical protein
MLELEKNLIKLYQSIIINSIDDAICYNSIWIFGLVGLVNMIHTKTENQENMIKICVQINETQNLLPKNYQYCIDLQNIIDNLNSIVKSYLINLEHIS